MPKYRLKETYPVEVKNPDTGKIEIEYRQYNKEKYHGGTLLKVGDVVELSEAQLKLHGEQYFELVTETKPVTEAKPVTETEPITETEETEEDEVTRTQMIEENLDVFLDTPFSSTAIINGVELKGIFEEQYAPAYDSQTEGDRISFLISTETAQDINQGDPVGIGDREFEVKGKQKIDDGKFTELILKQKNI